jgi:hypothetical protein
MADYIDNATFTESIIKYRQECFDADEAGLERPVIPNDIAKGFLLLATRLSYSPNFVNYSYRSEFISEAMIVCCSKITNFDPTITKNAFAYFTQLCWYSFIGVINEEKKEAYVKAKSFYNAIEENGNPFEAGEVEEEHDIQSDFIPYFDVVEFERKDSERRAKNRKKQDIGTIENMMEESPDGI